MSASILKVAFLGAGNVNFGGPEGPWDHASRLEQYHLRTKANIAVTAVIDPDVGRANTMLDQRKAKKESAHLFEHTHVYPSLAELWKVESDKPTCLFVGLPPECHGSTSAPFDIEVDCAKHGVHLFVEKPLSCFPLEEVRKVGAALKEQKGLVVSVGYMLRYSAGVRQMKELIAKNGWKVVATVARYNCAYSSILKQAWWDDRRSGGPVVEQATHFCDLARFFAGEADLSSLNAIAVAPTGPMGPLSKISPTVDESKIDPSHRIPRATSAFWRYDSGAIGSLNHALLLQGTKYTSEFEVWGDGFRMVLVDPYHECKLFVRTVESDDDKEVVFEKDDMYYNELKAFLDAVVNGGADSKILSTYEDALKTYELTWAIRLASEKGWKK